MPRRLNVALNWADPYEDPNVVPRRAGIYMVMAGSRARNQVGGRLAYL